MSAPSGPARARRVAEQFLREAGVDHDASCGAAAALFLTGTETVVALLPRLVALLVDTGQQDADLDAAVDEALRFTAPSPAMLRRVAGSAANCLRA